MPDEVSFLAADSVADLRVSIEGTLDQPAGVTVQTKYAEFTVGRRVSVTGQPETWGRLRTRPAFEVAMLARQNDALTINLMRKRRTADDPWLTKVPGGYLWDEFRTFAPKKIAADTGLQFDPEETIELLGVIGHSEIKTPIALYYTFAWRRVGEPKPGMEVFTITLEKAVQMACANQIENDSSFHLIMKLYRLHMLGQL